MGFLAGSGFKEGVDTPTPALPLKGGGESEDRGLARGGDGDQKGSLKPGGRFRPLVIWPIWSLKLASTLLRASL